MKNVILLKVTIRALTVMLVSLLTLISLLKLRVSLVLTGCRLILVLVRLKFVSGSSRHYSVNSSHSILLIWTSKASASNVLHELSNTISR